LSTPFVFITPFRMLTNFLGTRISAIVSGHYRVDFRISSPRHKAGPR
jgi:hypothetical protein